MQELMKKKVDYGNSGWTQLDLKMQKGKVILSEKRSSCRNSQLSRQVEAMPPLGHRSAKLEVAMRERAVNS